MNHHSSVALLAILPGVSSDRTRRFAREVSTRSPAGMGYSAGWPGIGNATMASPAGMGDFGPRAFPYYQVSLNQIRTYPAAQAQQVFGKLQDMLANDRAAGLITDLAGAQAAFAAAADAISQKNDAANQATWDSIAAGLAQNATDLNNDIAYVNSQGNSASTLAGQRADAAQGGVANSAAGAMNVIAGGPDGSSVVDWNKAGEAFNQATGEGGTLAGPWSGLKKALIVGGVVLVAIGGGYVYVYGRATRRPNPGSARRANSPRTSRAPSRVAARRARRLAGRSA